MVYRLRNRVLRKAFERLERLDGKLSRVVLRGGRGSNAVSLPDIPDLGFQPSSIENLTKTAIDWYRQVTHTDDSPGYQDRDKELAFVEKYLALVNGIDSNT